MGVKEVARLSCKVGVGELRRGVERDERWVSDDWQE